MQDPLVLLPGVMCDARVFGPQVAALSPHFAVTVAPVTQGERVEEIASGLLDVLPRKFAVAGQALGGVVGMELLRRAPDRVSRIAFINTTALAETPQSAADLEALIIKARVGNLSEFVDGLLATDCLAPGPMRAQIVALLNDMADHIGADVIVKQMRALQRRRDYQAVLRRCKIPALVLCGEHDGPTPVKRNTFLAELIPSGVLSVVEGAGHLPTLEQPDVTTYALRQWLR